MIALALAVALWAAPAEPVLRVALTLSAPQVVVSGPAQVVGEGQSASLHGPLKADVEGREIRLGGRRYASGVELRPSGDEPLKIELRTRADRAVPPAPYRGSLLLFVTRRGTLMVVNQVATSDYLRGVVPLEIGSSAPPAALQAQAVASRSFALAYRGAGSKPVADFAVEYTQAYKGSAPEQPSTDAAVAATAGSVLLTDGKPLQALYCACCGGVTATAEEVWKANLPCLASAFDDTDRAQPRFDEDGVRTWLAEPHGWCKDDRQHRWTRRFTWDRLSALVASRLPRLEASARVGELTDLRVARRGPSGRVQQLDLMGREGAVRINGELARRLLADDEQWLPSSLFCSRRDGHDVVLDGGGAGHGVGMCQAGAVAQARLGRSHAEILAFYYPGATLGDVPQA